MSFPVATVFLVVPLTRVSRYSLLYSSLTTPGYTIRTMFHGAVMNDQPEEMSSAPRKPVTTGLLRFFVLPPVEKRRMIGGIIKKYNYPDFSTEADDTYIYYLVMKYSFFVSSFFSILYWVSYAFHTRLSLFFFTIDVWHYNILARAGTWLEAHGEPGDFVRYSPVASMICSYPFVVGTAVLLIFIPYAWLLFWANVDFDATDLLHWDQALVQKKKGDPHALFKAALKSLLVYLAGFFVSFGLPFMVLHYYPFLEQSGGLFVLILCGFSWLYAIGMSSIVFCYAISYQLKEKRGPFFRNNSPRSCQQREGENS